MPARIEKIDLPGIGTRHDLLTESGRRVGVISHRSGERQLSIFDEEDPDAALVTVDLNELEAVGLADILGSILGGMAGGQGGQAGESSLPGGLGDILGDLLGVAARAEECRPVDAHRVESFPTSGMKVWLKMWR